MYLQRSTALVTAMMLLCGVCRADFKYSESTKMTGGAMMSAVKMAGIFSKDARQAAAPTIRTVMVKGNKMRDEHSDGRIQIIDLEGRRFIEIDPKTKTYGIMTFEDFRQAIQRKQQEAQEKMKAEQAKHPDKNANVKITPKFESSETGATKTIMGLATKEVKAKVEMQIASDDPKTQGQQVSTVVNTDQWIAQDVPGYGEIRAFYLKMAKELDWLPGQVMQGMANSNVQASLGELQKGNLAHITGMPIVSYVSMTMVGSGDAQAAAQTQPQAPPPQKHEDDSIPTSTSAAVAKGLGGLFGKKKQKDSQGDASNNKEANPASTPGSLMDLQTEVTSYSSDSLDSSLFGPPPGFTQTQRNPDDVLGGSHHQ